LKIKIRNIEVDVPGCIEVEEVGDEIVCSKRDCEDRDDCLMAEIGRRPSHTVDRIPGLRMEGGLRVT